jgi:hypothetical protein
LLHFQRRGLFEKIQVPSIFPPDPAHQGKSKQDD